MFAEDFSAFLNTNEFAQVATVGAGSMLVIFDAPAEQGLGGLIESVGPSVLAKAADVAALAVAHGTAVTVQALAYTVCGIEPDGTGLTTLRLRRA